MTNRFERPNWDIIQGGMGVAVSGYRLAGATGRTAVGVVSGTAIGDVLARRLQRGDPSGEMRRALETFPNQRIATLAVDMFFREGGLGDGESYRLVPMFNHNTKQESITADMTVLGAYVEAYLAKLRAGEQGVIGLNLLTKLDRPNMHAIAGAMMAGVDTVVMGAGVPDQIPELLHKIKHFNGDPVTHHVHVQGAGPATTDIALDLARYDPDMRLMSHPAFLAVVAHHDLAIELSRRDFAPDGYVVEAPTAGGHNAPPKSSAKGPNGEPIYTERDVADLSKLIELSLTFWLAGQRGTYDDYVDALMSGARGVQVGTAFALAQESGWDPELKKQILAQIANEDGLSVRTDMRASPSGMPFKVAVVPDTLSDPDVYASRKRVCDVGHLRSAYNTIRRGKPAIDYRCPAEPADDYLRKAGALDLAPGQPKRRAAELLLEDRMCLCNGLLAAAGFPQVRENGEKEPPLVTIGDDANRFVRLLNTDAHGNFDPYKPITAERVLHYIRTGEKDLD